MPESAQTTAHDSVTSVWDLCVKLLEIYPQRPPQISADSIQAKLAKELAGRLEAFASAVVPGDHWKGDASCGKGNWSRTPWASVYDTRLTSKASNGVYPVIHFLFGTDDGAPQDNPGIRIGLGVSISAFKGADREAQVTQVLEELRSVVGQEQTFGSFWPADSNESRPTVTPGPGLAREYADGMILEKFAPITELSSKQAERSDDFQQLLGWYYDWVSYKKTEELPIEEQADAFLKTMQEYYDSGTVFLSPTKNQLYCVEQMKESRCRIGRLSANKPAWCTASSFQAGLERLKTAGGRLPFKKFVVNSQLTRTTYSHAPCTALTADRSEFLLLESTDQASQLLCEYIDAMRVDESSGIPKLYKPLILASVLEAVDTGELKQNRIEFPWVMEKMQQQGKRFGMDFSQQNVADGFTRLSRDLFWLLCFEDPENAITLLGKNRINPSNVNQYVRYAKLRKPFWEALQVKAGRDLVLNHLRETRIEPYVNQIAINRRLLKLAVDRTIRPFLFDQRKLKDPKAEGYHHQEVIPTAQPHLAPGALDADAVTHLKSALGASSNLLHQQEVIRPNAFLDQANREEVRDHFVDLLYGSEALKKRLTRFFDWARYRKVEDGSTIGFNHTTVSYLLAMSNPQAYAFCKPEVYQSAARALIGREHVEKDPIERIVHATRLYQAALGIFQEEHHLPFTDLMHTHIAFYIMKDNYHGMLQWDSLLDEKHKVSMTHDLNLVLYGPPGTGKTYHAMSQAVEICDGMIPQDRASIVARFKTLLDEGQIEFVTFHQSYGYEDFVEGIRPVLTADEESDAETQSDQVQYECRDGVLKRICALATSKETKRKTGYEFDPSEVRVWKMSLGNTQDPEQATIYDDCIENNYLRLGYGGTLDFTNCNTRAEVEKKVFNEGKEFERKEATTTFVHTFKNKINIDDLVVISDGNRKFRAIGRVSGEYQLLDRDSYRQMRPVEWLVVYEQSLPSAKICEKVFSQMSVYQLRPAVLKTNALREVLRGDEVNGEHVAPATGRNHVLIIDEINRGNIAKILGELITLVEPDKRLGAENELQATLPYSGKPFGVPNNLYIIGTMNTADRSIAFLDTALRRRFKFEEIMPSSEVVRREVGERGVVEDVDLAHLLEIINQRVELLYDRDHQIGHSYFLGVASLTDLREVFCVKVIPLLQEYFYGDWAKICMILGCPYDTETANSIGNNSQPLITAQLLRVSDLPGGEQDDCEDKIHCEINRDFVTADKASLFGFFQGILTGQQPKDQE